MLLVRPISLGLRHPPIACLVAPAPELPRDLLRDLEECGVELGIPMSDEVPEVASLLVRSFPAPPPLPAPPPEPAAQPQPWEAFMPQSTPPSPPPLQQQPAQMWGEYPVSEYLMPAELRDATPELVERWRTACKGLSWRLGSRLDAHDGAISSSLQTSLLLALRESNGAGTGGASGGGGSDDGGGGNGGGNGGGGGRALVGCAELSIRPIDGTLAGEFAIPACFCLHDDAPFGAYLSNMAVSPSHRGRGFGSMLLRACEFVASEIWDQPELFLHSDLNNAAASRLYQQYDQLPEFDAQCQQPEAAAPTAPMEREVEKVPVDLDGSPQQRGADEQEVAVAGSATDGPRARNRLHRKRLGRKA